jgi:hypothetical protein
MDDRSDQHVGGDEMPRVSQVPFATMDPELRDSMSAYDDELGGSEFVRVFAHRPDVFKNFIAYYFPLISETRDSVDMALTELVRLKVAEINACPL